MHDPGDTVDRREYNPATPRTVAVELFGYESSSKGDDPKILPDGDYVEGADYDPCREWLRMITAIVCVACAVGAVYPIHLGVDCYFDNFHDGVVDLTRCKKLFSIEYSLTVLAVAVLVELFMLAVFIYSCRHEFCGVKRRYKTGLLCCGKQRPASAKVYPTRLGVSSSTDDKP